MSKRPDRLNPDPLADQERIDGAIYGMGLGDSWGFPTEFMRHKGIIFMAPPPPHPLQITDDTQMSLYNSKALENIFERELDLDEILTDVGQQTRVRKLFAEEHLKFEVDPDNNRAPGLTVMSALWVYRRSARATGLEGSSPNDSKGCGTIMRSPWFGLLPLDRNRIAALAILQSETTHGHAQASLSAAVAAIFLKGIFEGKISLGRDSAINRLRSVLLYATSIASNIGRMDSNLVLSEDFQDEIAELRDLIYNSLVSIEALSEKELMDPDADICKWFGQGWVAEEALLCALAAFALYGNDAYGGIRRLVYSNGDSDSIAAIGGSFFGAYVGIEELEAQARSNGVRLRGSFEARYNAELEDASNFFGGLI